MTSTKIKVSDLRCFNQVGGWKAYDVNGLDVDNVNAIMDELTNKYYTVNANNVGTYFTGNKCFGYILCKDRI